MSPPLKLLPLSFRNLHLLIPTISHPTMGNDDALKKAAKLIRDGKGMSAAPLPLTDS